MGEAGIALQYKLPPRRGEDIIPSRFVNTQNATCEWGVGFTTDYSQPATSSGFLDINCLVCPRPKLFLAFPVDLNLALSQPESLENQSSHALVGNRVFGTANLVPSDLFFRCPGKALVLVRI
jgi:hypothetical protein